MGTYFPPGMPLPAIEADTREFWEGCKRHKLMIQRCRRCGVFRYVPMPVCHECYSFEHEWVQSQGVGDVYSYIIVHNPAHPATKAAVPYNAVVVQLRDCGGVKMTSNLLGVPPEDVKIGMPVRVAWEDVTPEITLPRFQPL